MENDFSDVYYLAQRLDEALGGCWGVTWRENHHLGWSIDLDNGPKAVSVHPVGDEYLVVYSRSGVGGYVRTTTCRSQRALMRWARRWGRHGL